MSDSELSKRAGIMVQNKNKNKQILEGSDTLRCLHLDKKKRN